jgi:hypothetical protein
MHIRHSPNISISSKVSRFKRFRRDRSGRDRQAQTRGRAVLSPSAADDLNPIVPAIDWTQHAGRENAAIHAQRQAIRWKLPI